MPEKRVVEIYGPKREREDAESEEERAKRSRLTAEQQVLLNALRKCSGRKKDDKRSSTCDVEELFPSPQVTGRARRRGLRGGWSLNKTVGDPITGRTWDLLSASDVNSCVELVLPNTAHIAGGFHSCEAR